MDRYLDDLKYISFVFALFVYGFILVFLLSFDFKIEKLEKSPILINLDLTQQLVEVQQKESIKDDAKKQHELAKNEIKQNTNAIKKSKKIIQKPKTKEPTNSVSKEQKELLANEIFNQTKDNQISQNTQAQTLSKNDDIYLKIKQEIQKSQRYPKSAIKLKQQGVVYIRFKIHKNGNISDIEVIKSSNFSTLDDDAIRSINDASKYFPAMQEVSVIEIELSYKIKKH